MEYITQYIFCYEHEQVYDLIYVFNSLIIRSSSAEFMWFDHANLSNLILPSQKKEQALGIISLSNDKTCVIKHVCFILVCVGKDISDVYRYCRGNFLGIVSRIASFLQFLRSMVPVCSLTSAEESSDGTHGAAAC